MTLSTAGLMLALVLFAGQAPVTPPPLPADLQQRLAGTCPLTSRSTNAFATGPDSSRPKCRRRRCGTTTSTADRGHPGPRSREPAEDHRRRGPPARGRSVEPHSDRREARLQHAAECLPRRDGEGPRARVPRSTSGWGRDAMRSTSRSRDGRSRVSIPRTRPWRWRTPPPRSSASS